MFIGDGVIMSPRILFSLLVALLGMNEALAADAPALTLRVDGNRLLDGSGKPLQLRGVNASALEFVAAQGWSAADPWGGQAPDWRSIAGWKTNTVRLPLNEASWLGYTCTDGAGATRSADPGRNYQRVVRQAVDAATAQGMYVILDLHWTAPARFCPLAQNPLPDVDNAPTFWAQLAAAYKSYPNVLFELFNEPFPYWQAPGQDSWSVLRDGGAFTQFATGMGNRTYSWKSAGMQQLLDAVRATGATNVVLIGSLNWDQDLRQWVKYRPKDPLNQIAAVWHAYPNSDVVGSRDAALPKLGADAYDWAEAVLAAGFPILATEVGDRNARGTQGAAFLENFLPWADRHNVSYMGWTWNVWDHPDNVLIRDVSGTPTDGYGLYFKQHLTCRATTTTNCR